MNILNIPLPRLNLRRTFLIARRDFVGYIRTWGFWLTTFGPFIFLFALMLISLFVAKSEPVSHATIFDETGLHTAAMERQLDANYERDLTYSLKQFARFTVPKDQQEKFDQILETEGAEPARDFVLQVNPSVAKYVKLPQRKLVLVPAPANDIDALKQFIADEKTVTVKGESVGLNGFLHIYQQGEGLKAEYWTTFPNNSEMENFTNGYLAANAQNVYLEAGGLTRSGLGDARDQALKVSKYNPKKAVDDEVGQAITFEDSLPYIIASILSLMLWLTIFTGAYMLLVSMVEEKINKVLEMLLATTRFSEIFVGKLLGVALLTITSLLPWVILTIVGFYGLLSFGDASVIEGFDEAISLKTYIFLPIFLVLGYVFYGSMFIALGALSESMQDASTLMTPMVLLMTACLAVVPLGLNFPDSPILTFGQWFPFSAPFAAIVKLPSDPPLWETLGSVLSLILSTILVVWLSARSLQHGVLSGSGVALLKGWVAINIFRRKPSI